MSRSSPDLGSKKIKDSAIVSEDRPSTFKDDESTHHETIAFLHSSSKSGIFYCQEIELQSQSDEKSDFDENERVSLVPLSGSFEIMVQ